MPIHGDVVQTPEWVVGDLEISALRLLVAGAPDKTVASRLGVSHRTVQRHVREMMLRSGSRNRMQLGRNAARSGMPGLPGRIPHGAQRPDDVGVRLLRMLLMDLPWSTLPRSLDMSPRSAERRLQELMTLAGAASRAQLGWNITRLGWL